MKFEASTISLEGEKEREMNVGVRSLGTKKQRSSEKKNGSCLKNGGSHQREKRGERKINFN